MVRCGAADYGDARSAEGSGQPVRIYQILTLRIRGETYIIKENLVIFLTNIVKYLTKKAKRMRTITVCIGSGCHVKGSRQIIDILERLIAEERLDADVQLEACFCRNQCTEGVVISVDGRVFTGVSPENAEKFFRRMIGGKDNEND